jgi:hypothetical protein
MSFTIIPEVIDTEHRLGRHIHDRDETFNAHVAEKTGQQINSVTWVRECPPFDQGAIGSCTGNAAVGCLMTTPLYVATRVLNESNAVAVYTADSAISSPGDSYPPNDVGSTGPASAQACEQLGYITSYTHAVDLQGALEGLQSGPGSFGISWYDSFDTPLSTGECPLTPNASVRGGHEIEAYAVDTANQRVLFVNSWGPTWGGLANGTFWLSYATLTSLFAEQADATFFAGSGTGPSANTATCIARRAFDWFDSLKTK